MVTQHNLCVEPSVRIACATGIQQVVFVQNTLVQRLAVFPQSLVVIAILLRFAVLDRVVHIYAEMETGSELTHDELWLHTETYSPAVLGRSAS